MSSRNLIVLLFFLFMRVEVRSQVCTTTYKSNEYSFKNDSVSCPHCSIVTSVSYSQYYGTKTIYECCPGYKLLNTTLSPSRCNCVRVCDACSYGNCTKGNVCVCSEEYERYPPQSNTCIPKCGPGYNRLNGICVPTCYPECGNGTCVEGNQCKCSKGYKPRMDKPRCVPVCHNCYGICLAPGKCGCREGRILKHLTADNSNCVCDDDCDIKCANHICVLPKRAPPQAENNTTPHNSKAIFPYKNSSSFFLLYFQNKELDIQNNTYVAQSEIRHGDETIHMRNNCSLLRYVYISVGINIVLVLTCLIIIWRNPGILKCRREGNHTNSNDSVQCSYHQYEVIKENGLHKLNLNCTGCLQNNTHMQSVVETPVSEGSTEQDPLCYDYVQLPLPINYKSK